MKIKEDALALPIEKTLVALIEGVLAEKGVTCSQCVILNFRDPSYSAKEGGYHPVEIMLDKNGLIQYITDFAYMGQGDFAELDKELDFDFAAGVFQQMGRCYPIADGCAIFAVWQSNFCAYFEWGVFEVSSTVWGDV